LRELLFIAPSRQERQEHKKIVALFASLREYTYVSEFGINPIFAALREYTESTEIGMTARTGVASLNVS
jgi:hypothetical protein